MRTQARTGCDRFGISCVGCCPDESDFGQLNDTGEVMQEGESKKVLVCMSVSVIAGERCKMDW